ncbi:hypothetical protein IDH44_01550 [Paenibacillus sp. IB182496]|uniref:Uncharacterized protein n=1 Tax=Paenibacillus sabuli TaxID=2772509 RepID=A0A927BQY4_9BACL|nr:hypothetical protein [Paenibacillus sabuli]MBD2843863.1 hypothetical protein [Paenibacillus sabuli]
MPGSNKEQEQKARAGEEPAGLTTAGEPAALRSRTSGQEAAPTRVDEQAAGRSQASEPAERTRASEPAAGRTRASEQAAVRARLEEALGGLRFGGKAAVLRRTHPATRRERLAAWWNRELEVPVLPAGALLLAGVLILALAYGPWDDSIAPTAVHEPKRTLVEAGGNLYWQDEYERAVALRDPAH